MLAEICLFVWASSHRRKPHQSDFMRSTLGVVEMVESVLSAYSVFEPVKLSQRSIVQHSSFIVTAVAVFYGDDSFSSNL